MAREKEYLYQIDIQAANGMIIKPHIAYRPDRLKPWTVDIDWIEISPTYRDIGHAQAFLRKHFRPKDNPSVKAVHYIGESNLFEQLHVMPCDR